MNDPTTTTQLERLARGYATEAMTALVSIVRNPDAKDSDRIAAAREIFERGHGKSRTPDSKSAKKLAQRVAHMTTAQLMAEFQRMRAQSTMPTTTQFAQPTQLPARSRPRNEWAENQPPIDAEIISPTPTQSDEPTAQEIEQLL